MKAFALDELGQPGSLHDLPVPEPGEGQVRIRVAVAGLNPFDNAVVQGYLKDRMEHRFPLVPGMDASGTVEAIGEGVEDWAVGDEVFGSVGKRYLGEGTLADYLNGLLADFPTLLLGSYPEFSNPEYKVKVTLESRDQGYLEQALAELLSRLPAGALVKVA